MKRTILSNYLILGLVAIALVGCFTVPDPIYSGIDADEENAKTPHIVSVDKTSMWTDDTLTITGTNFSDSLEWNFVYFATTNEPTIGDTTITIDSITTGGTYSITNYFKDIDVTTSGYITTVTSDIAGVMTSEEYRVATSYEEYIANDSTSMTIKSITTEPVFTAFDTTFADTTVYDTAWNGIITSHDSTFVVSIDTTGYTKMVQTVTTYGSISEWTCHTNELGTVVSATTTELKVIPPEVDVTSALITIHKQDAIAPAQWGFINIMVKP